MIRRTLQTYRIWRKRHAQRLSYQNENSELRSLIRAQGLRQEALTELLRMKQEKITRLQETIKRMHGPTPHSTDMRPEVLIKTAEQWVHDFSEDFDVRQKEYEQTGHWDRQERVTTTAADPDDKAR